MNGEFDVQTNVVIQAPPETVWYALTEPKIIKRYLPNCTTSTSWKIGEPIIQTWEQDGKTCRDKGTVLKVDPPHELSYSSSDSRSGEPHLSETYHELSFKLEAEGEGTLIKCLIQNISSEQQSIHLLQHWKMAIARLKLLLEESTELSAY